MPVLLLLSAGACIGLDKLPGPPDRTEGGDGTTTLGTLSIGASKITFGDVAVGDSADQDLTLSSTDGSAIDVNADLDDLGVFTLSSTDVVVTDEEVLTLGFAPDRAEHFEGSLTLSVPDGDTVVLPVTGDGTEGGSGGDDSGDTTDTHGGDDSGHPAASGDIDVSPTTYDFGSVDVGSASSTSFTVRNTGSDDLRITDVTTSHSVFTTGGTLSPPVTLAPGASKVLQVTFSPDRASSWHGSVTIASDDPDTPSLVVTLQGTGQESCSVCAPIIDVDTGGSDPFSIGDFLSLGGSTDSRTITVSNIGDMDLDVNNVLVKNDFLATCGTFSVSGWHGAVTLAPYDSTTFELEYTATGSCLEVPQASLDANVAHILSDDPTTNDWVIELGGIGL